MKIHGEIQKTQKKDSDGAPIYTMLASTPDLDRDGEILVSLGANVAEFKENPVILGFHNRSAFPIGKGVDVRVSEEGVEVDFVFASIIEEGRKAQAMVDGGFMKTFSVGARINKYLDRDEFGDKKEVEIETERGKTKIPVTDGLYGIIPAWTLYEVSLVPIPANPAAQLKEFMAGEMTFGKSPLMHFADTSIQALCKQMDSLLNFSGVIPTHSCPVFEGSVESEKTLARLALWASEGSAKKEDVDWNLYSQGFAFVDPDETQAFTGYSYLHHVVDDDGLKLDKAGLFNAMADFLEDSDLEEETVIQGIYDHLYAHYNELDVKAPSLELFGKMTEEQGNEIRRKGNLEQVTDNDDPAPTPTPDALQDTLEGLRKGMKGLTEEMMAMRITLEVSTERQPAPSNKDDDAPTGFSVKDLFAQD